MPGVEHSLLWTFNFPQVKQDRRTVRWGSFHIYKNLFFGCMQGKTGYINRKATFSQATTASTKNQHVLKSQEPAFLSTARHFWESCMGNHMSSYHITSTVDSLKCVSSLLCLPLEKAAPTWIRETVLPKIFISFTLFAVKMWLKWPVTTANYCLLAKKIKSLFVLYFLSKQKLNTSLKQPFNFKFSGDERLVSLLLF